VFVLFRRVAELSRPTSNCRGFNKTDVKHTKVGKKEWVSSDAEYSSRTQSTSIQKGSLTGRSRHMGKGSKFAKPNLYYKSPEREEWNMTTGMQMAKFDEDLNRVSMVFDSRAVRKALTQTGVHDKLSQNFLQPSHLSRTLAEKDKIKRSRRRNKKEEYKHSKKSVKSGLSSLPQSQRTYDNSPWASYTASEYSSRISQRKRSSKSKNNRSVYRNKRESCLFNDADLTESNSDIWRKILGEEKERISRKISPASVRQHKKENKVSPIQVWTPKGSFLETTDDESKGQTVMDYEGKDRLNRNSKLQKISMSHKNPNTPIFEESQSDWMPITSKAVMRNSKEKNPIYENLNVDMKKIKSITNSNVLTPSSKNHNSPTGSSLLPLSRERRHNRNEKKNPETPVVQEVQELERLPSVGDVKLISRNLIQSSLEMREEGDQWERCSNSVVLLKKCECVPNITPRKAQAENKSELDGMSQNDLQNIPSFGKVKLQNNEETSAKGSSFSSSSSNDGTSFDPKEAMILLESLSRSTKSYKSGGRSAKNITSETYETTSERSSISSQQEMKYRVRDSPNLSGILTSGSNLEDTLNQLAPSQVARPEVGVSVAEASNVALTSEN